MLQVMTLPRWGRNVDEQSCVSVMLDDDLVRVGSAHDCELCLPNPHVAKHHATIARRGDSYALVDEGSAGGTWVVEYGSDRPMRPVAPRVAHALNGWTIVRFGALDLVLNPRAQGPADDPLDAWLFTLELLAQDLRQRGHHPFPAIYVRQGPDRKTRIDLHALPGKPRVVGRGLRVDVPLRDIRASRRHFEVMCDTVLWVRDLGSAAGTWFGETRLEPGKFVPWERDTLLRAGQNVFLYRYPLADAMEALELGERDPDTTTPAGAGPDSSDRQGPQGPADA